MQLLTPRTSRSTQDEAPAPADADSKARLGAPVSGPGEPAASTMKRAFSAASALLQLPRHGLSLHLCLQPVCLPSSTQQHLIDYNVHATLCRSTIWCALIRAACSYVDNTGTYSSNLQAANVPVVLKTMQALT